MNSLIGFFRNFKLNQKLSLLVFTLAFIPLACLAIVIFVNMQNIFIEERLSETRRELTGIQTQAEKTAELCAMTMQFFMSSPKLHDFLFRSKGGEHFPLEELLAFYREDVIGSFEKVVNAIPYLYQVRLYFSNPNIPEFFPIMYHDSRLERLSWASADWISGTWQYDYIDSLFPQEVFAPSKHIMSLVSEMTDYKDERIGIIEVAVRMDEIFPDLFHNRGSGFHAFVTESSWFSQPSDESFWNTNITNILSTIDNAFSGDSTIDAKIAGRTAIISSINIKQLNGRYIIVMFKDEITSEISARQNAFILVSILTLLFLAYIVNLLVKAMLRRFYIVVETIHNVRSGALDVEVPHIGNDEIGLLGNQVNQMLDRIRILMDENVKRELHAKNSEIRALHSQINAHFIYNVLETIKMMAEVDEQYEISDALTSLGKLLRYSMRWTSENVTLEEEIEHLQSYLLLMNLRYDYEITVNINIPSHLYGEKIPKLTLQPIAENAVTHGIEEIAQDALIELSATEFHDYYTITITDYGKGMTPEELSIIEKRLSGEIGDESTDGIGIKNVNERIDMAFGSDYGLSIASESGKGTSVTIRLPYS
ncbi:MAG: sensor histidine kinase [Oscillospiraceae bacterium]|nr:sensor histidine kinase [Oscillospiraceae bacterium]